MLLGGTPSKLWRVVGIFQRLNREWAALAGPADEDGRLPRLAVPLDSLPARPAAKVAEAE